MVRWQNGLMQLPTKQSFILKWTVGSNPTLTGTNKFQTRDGVVVTFGAHNPKIEGAIPSPATISN